MKNLKCKVIGNNEIRLNNPQSADPFNKYARELKVINNKRKKTDNDLIKLANLTYESKLYFDDKLGVYVPSNWIVAGLSAIAYKQTRISKAGCRGAIYPNSKKYKLYYEGMKKVKKIDDLVLDDFFRTTEFYLISGKRISKPIPTFYNWSFEIDIDFDEEIISVEDMELLLKVMVYRKGFGDYRPTYGRGTIQDLIITDLEI